MRRRTNGGGKKKKYEKAAEGFGFLVYRLG